MDLYKDEEKFEDAINATSNILKIRKVIVEKDYFVTILLREIKRRIPGILFKGGTCLSKCFKLIDRFSEDIDLTLSKECFNQSNKRNVNKEIVKICDDLHFEIINRDIVINHSHGNYNCYEISYPHKYEEDGIIPYIKLELVFMQKPYPERVKSVSSLIEDALVNDDTRKIFNDFELCPFDIKVQSLERTFVDKVFAICDYYLIGKILRQSRHIYDIYKIMNAVDMNIVRSLIREVRIEKSTNKQCKSASDNIDINSLLKKIVKSQIYKKDYEEVTLQLLSKKVDYDIAIKALDEIIALNIF